MKQNKQKGSIDTTLGIFLAIVVIIFLMFLTNSADISRLEKYDTCLTQAITVNADPNDTTERSILLANCMDK